jgi:hypothetical protein
MTAPAALDEHLRFAIAHRRLIQLSYGGHLRVVEPHDYGLKNGAAMLLGYQVRGGSASRGGGNGWRLLKVARIDACMVWETTFAGGRADSRGHMEWDELFARVAPAPVPR